MLERLQLFIIAAFCCCLAACDKGPERTSAIGEVFVGPATLILRQDLGLKSPIVGTVKHGDRLEVIQTRRRFTRVRTAQNVEGWTDQEKLLSTEQIKTLNTMAKWSSELPSQGTATVYEPLNMHTAPNKFSPSFYQIAENETISVLLRKVTPRVRPAIEKKAVPPPPSGKKKKGKKDEKLPPVSPPLMPQGPPVPNNWRELSFDYRPQVGTVNQSDEIPSDAWSFVRTKDGRAGWVLFRLVFMQIPDDVAQYASGERITSYFAMGQPPADDSGKKHWLWTTLSDNKLKYEFDGVRLFYYNPIKHRYETAFSDRNARGHFPTIVNPPQFSYVVEDDEGKLFRKTYNFEGRRAKLISKLPFTPPSNRHLDELALDPHKVKEAEETKKLEGWLELITSWNPWGRK